MKNIVDDHLPLILLGAVLVMAAVHCYSIEVKCSRAGGHMSWSRPAACLTKDGRVIE